METLKRAVRPDEAEIRVRSLYITKQGKVKVTSASKTDAEKLCKEVRIKSSGKLVARNTKSLRPRVSLKFLPKTMEEEQVLESLMSHSTVSEAFSTTEDLQRNFKIRVHIRNRRRSDTKIIIAEVSPKMRNILLSAVIGRGMRSTACCVQTPQKC